MCTVILPPGDNPIAVKKYIAFYHQLMHKRIALKGVLKLTL